METVRCERRGLEEYKHTHAFQIEVRNRIIQGETGSVLISVCHPSVITIGRAGTRDDILADQDILAEKNIEVIEVERGGKVTYHGPGQAVMYPVFNLKHFTKDIHYFLRQLENVIIQTLAVFSITGIPGEDTGVYVGERKIGSIGIAVKKWVTWHGISLNVHKDPNFSSISPCGLPPSAITSMEEEGVYADISRVEAELIESFKKEFNIEILGA